MKRVPLLLVIPLLFLLAACNTDPKAASKKYVDNGNKYFNRGKYKEASIMYRRALAKDARYGEAWYRLGLVNMQLGIPVEAIRSFSRAHELDPANTDATVKLGDLELLFFIGNPQSNRAMLGEVKDLDQQLLKKDPKSYDGLRIAGYIDLVQKDLKGAIQKFEEANQVKPDQPELVLSLVQSLFAEQQNDIAEKYAKQLIEKHKNYGAMYDALYYYYVRNNHPDLGEAILKEKIQNNPSQGPYALQLALHYYMTNRKQDMTATLARLTSDLKTYPDAHLEAGDFYLRIRDLDDALQQYDLGQKEDSKNKRTYQKRMVEVLGTEGKHDQATKIVDALLKQDPKDSDVIAMHATLLLQTGDPKQIKTVIGELQPIVAKTPRNATLHYNLARAYMAASDSQNMDQARIHFQEAIKLEPRYMPARLGLGELEMARGENAPAVQTAEDILKADPTNLPAHLMRANGLMRIGENQKAREEITTAMKMYPKSNDLMFELGQVEYLDKNYKQSEAAFQTLIAAGDPRGLPGVMESKVAQGQWDQAIESAENQLKQAPDRSDYRLALAKIYFRAAKYAESSVQYQMLIDKNPKVTDLYVRLGESKENNHDVNGAVEAFKKAREIDPANYLPLLELALLYNRAGRDEEARTAYEEVIKLQPDNVEALNNLAYLKADQGIDLDQALAYAQRAQQKRPNDPNVVDTLALIYIHKNLTDDSLRMLRDLVTKTPNNPTFHLHLALALYQKGDRPQAKKELETAMRNKPSDREQGKIKELLAKVG
ncbi:MAG TPA: tetratricopeptide repeat protein [Bryobacteraceae bacterium]|nr:tetratricopeptide repeat protein [Bryobacteraceae bacterium]